MPEAASIDQNPLLWPLALVKNPYEDFAFDYNINFDEKKLVDILKSSALFTNVTEPKDASLAYEDGQFKVIKEVEGNKIDYDKFMEKIKDAVYTHKQTLKLEDSDYVGPEIREGSKELDKLLKDAKSVEKISIAFNFNGFDFKLEGKELIDMFDVNHKSFELNYDKLTDYVNNIADETDTYGTERSFNATGIGKITVAPGVYGFILDVAKTVDKVYELVNERKSGEIEPVYERAGLDRYADGSDIGDTYVEVDLSRQYMWYYKNGELILETPIVSGLAGTSKWATNKGVGSILSKETNATLKGAGFDGSKYETPVSYWMPIGWDGEGFHDAPWRGGAFGGSIYMSNGSHGCINMPPDKAKILFDNVAHNTPVVVYESSTSYSPTMSY